MHRRALVWSLVPIAWSVGIAGCPEPEPDPEPEPGPEESTPEPCPEGQVWEVGECLEATAGPSMEPTHRCWASVPERSMTHPRGIWSNDEVVLGCFTDSVAVISYDDMELDAGHGSTARQETLMETSGQIYCDSFGFDVERRLGVVPSRGAMGLPGGITTWRFPELTSPPSGPPEFLDHRPVPAGAEGVVVRHGYAFVAEKPDRLGVYRLEDDGALELEAGLILEETGAAWAVAEVGDRLVVTDAGYRPPEGEDDPHDVRFAATLSVVDISQPGAPVLLSSTPACVARSAAAVGDDSVVLACGNVGLQFWSLADPEAPVLLAEEDTPGVATSVSHDGGYLLVADWDAGALYDVAEPGTPRLIQATNLPFEIPDSPDITGLPDTATNEAAFALLDGDRYLIGDLMSLRIGRVVPGRVGPSLDIFDRRALVSSAAAPEGAVTIRFRNAGRAPLTLEAFSPTSLELDDAPRVIAPFEDSTLEMAWSGDGTAVDWPYALYSDDPLGETRVGVVQDVGPGYAPGQTAPTFRLPALGLCEGDDCEPGEIGCWSTEDVPPNTPVVYAWFSSW